jgi:hypothetical protein
MIERKKPAARVNEGEVPPEEHQQDMNTGCLAEQIQTNLQWNKERGFEPSALLDDLYMKVLADEENLKQGATEKTSRPADFSRSTDDSLAFLCQRASESTNYVDCLSFAQAVMRTSNEGFPALPKQGSSEPTDKTGLSKEQWIHELRQVGLMEHIYQNAKATAEHSPSGKIDQSLISFFEAETNKSRFLVYAGRRSEQESWTSTHAMIVLGPTLDGEDLWIVHKRSKERIHSPSITTLKKAIYEHDVNYERELQFDLQMALLCPDSFSSGSDFKAHLADLAIRSIEISHKLPEDLDIIVRGKLTLNNFHFHSLHYALQNLTSDQLAEMGINSDHLSDLMEKLSFEQQAVLLNDGRASGIFDYKSLEALTRKMDLQLAPIANKYQEASKRLEAHSFGESELNQDEWVRTWKYLDILTPKLIDTQNLVCELERQTLLLQPSQAQCKRALDYLRTSTKFERQHGEVHSNFPELKLFLTAYRLADGKLAASILDDFGETFLKNVFQQRVPFHSSSRYELEPNDPCFIELCEQQSLFGSGIFNLLGEEGLLQATFREFIPDSGTPEKKQGQANKLRAIISICDTVYEDDHYWKDFKRRVLSSGLIAPLEGELEALNSDLFD